MNIATIKCPDIANGLGCRVSVYISGSIFSATDYLNNDISSYDYGSHYNQDIKDEIINLMDKSYINGLTILGGEPLALQNVRGTLDLVTTVKSMYPKKSIWLYTNFEYEKLKSYIESEDSFDRILCYKESLPKLFKQIDILVDGPFEKDKKDDSLGFRKSSNQRIINMRETLKTGTVSLYYN